MEVELGRRGAKSKYDFAKWFSGDVFHLQQGVDFPGHISSFRMYLYQVAAKKGYVLKTAINGNVLSFQATPKG